MIVLMNSLRISIRVNEKATTYNLVQEGLQEIQKQSQEGWSTKRSAENADEWAAYSRRL